MKTATDKQETTSTNVDQKHSSDSLSEELIQVKPIEDTPFTAVKVDEHWFLALGKYRLTQPLQSEEECINEAKDASWSRIMQVMQIMIEENETKTQK